MIKIPLVDLKAQYASIKEEIDEAIRKTIESAQFILGPDVESLEKEIASYLQVNFAIGVASGTDALRLALLACDIKPGDEVITTPFTFIATAEAITQCGAVPVFADIEPKTFNINPDKIREKINKKTKALLPVHLYGQSCNMEPILNLAKKSGVKVIEDCAQALGAKYRGQWVGSLGDAGCLSFFPSKTLGAYGDGGMVVTNNPQIAEKVIMLRNHGCYKKYYHVIPGFNSRLDSLQAAILKVKIKYLDKWIELRRHKASTYANLLIGIDGIALPLTEPYSEHIFNYFTIRIKKTNRDELKKYLQQNGVETAIYYPLSLHLQEVYKSLPYRSGDFPESEKAQEQVLSLPMYPELSEDKIERICKLIKEFFNCD